MKGKEVKLMRPSKRFLLILLLVCAPVTCFALEPPKIVTDGLDAYKNSGNEEAFKIWIKGSPLENDKTSYMNMKGGMTQIETIYGKMIGYEILKTINISHSTTRTYAVMLYEKGPVYLYADCYKSPNGWIIPELQFHTKPQMVLPQSLFFGQ
jgi:hypothetical protein